MAKADRLLSLLWLLRSRGKLTAAEIAQQLEVTLRTVYRYIDALCESGAPIASEGGPGGGYLLLETFREPPVFFDAEERTALLHAATLADRAGYPFSDSLDRALRKIRHRMDPSQLEELARHAAAFETISEADAPPLTGLLQRLEAAAAESRCVRIDYAAIEDTRRSRRTVEPYGVVYWSGRWYLVGFCRLRRDMRLFRVDRISSIEEGSDHFERPRGFSAGEWFARKLMPPRPDGGSPLAVSIEGQPAAIDHLARNWFLKPFVTAHSRDRLELSLDRDAARAHLPGLLLGYGTSLRVTSPRELGGRIAELAAEVSRFYESREND